MWLLLQDSPSFHSLCCFYLITSYYIWYILYLLYNQLSILRCIAYFVPLSVMSGPYLNLCAIMCVVVFFSILFSQSREMQTFVLYMCNSPHILLSQDPALTPTFLFNSSAIVIQSLTRPPLYDKPQQCKAPITLGVNTSVHAGVKHWNSSCSL